MPVTPVNAHCLFLPRTLPQLPPFYAAQARSALAGLLPRVEPFLELGRFHTLLPPRVAEETVLARCDLPGFERLYRGTRIVEASSGLRARLETLLGLGHGLSGRRGRDLDTDFRTQRGEIEHRISQINTDFQIFFVIFAVKHPPKSGKS
ncbi:MAG: hypothetical protein R2856_13945 [Caldilineaceae bacterium]